MKEHPEEEDVLQVPDEHTRRWLAGELQAHELDKLMAGPSVEVGKWSFPQPLTRRLVLRSALALFLVWPTVPWITNQVAGSFYRNATLEQLNPDPEKRQAQRVLEYMHPFWVTVLAELLVMGIWAYVCVPGFLKLYQFNKQK